MASKNLHGRQIPVGTIFDRDGDFYQVIKSTKTTVTVLPIEHEFIGNADPYGWEHAYMPKKDCFTTSWHFTDSQNTNGKRCTVKDYTQDKSRPQIDVGCYFDAHVWDGRASIFDSYN